MRPKNTPTRNPFYQKGEVEDAPMQTAQIADYDIFIIGGGINGCGIARECAAMGYHVMLAEMNDLSSGTSSWSTKLIHGGFRYLEYYEFRLVREALRERETLMGMAPHLIHPLRFVLPHSPAMRPKWLLRLGLFFYDHLGGRKILPASQAVKLRQDPVGACLKEEFTSAFEYSDCFVDDNRLTILNARAAKAFGATISPRTKVQTATHKDGIWHIKTDQGDITARYVINAAGPWVDEVRQAAKTSNVKNIRLVRGSHILTKRLFDHDKAYIFQNDDGRILFAIPYLGEFTLLGTTDVDHDTAPDKPEISSGEISYICREVSRYLKRPVTEADIVATYSGVRPLYDDGAADAKSATRDYVLSFEAGTSQSWLNIFGGKLTTYRKLARAVAALMRRELPEPTAQRAGTTPLPGGALGTPDFAAFLDKTLDEFSHLDSALVTRLATSYGADIYEILGTKDAPKPLGEMFGAGLSQAEVDFLVREEWAHTAEDILERRTKLHYFADEAVWQKLTAYLASAKA